MKQIFIAVFSLFLCQFSFGQDISLPQPQKTGGKPLMDVLNQRQSIRSFSGKEMDKQTMSNLLWATYGFNREDKRTIPTSQNRQELEVYVMTKEGIYLYDAKANILIQKKKGDHREALGQPNITNDTALTIIFVADLDKASSKEAAYNDTGYAAQNIYLFAASEGLGTVSRGSFNRDTLPKVLELEGNRIVTLVHPVGYPQ